MLATMELSDAKIPLVPVSERVSPRKPPNYLLFFAYAACLLFTLCVFTKLVTWSLPAYYINDDSDELLRKFHSFAYPNSPASGPLSGQSYDAEDKNSAGWSLYSFSIFRDRYMKLSYKENEGGSKPNCRKEEDTSMKTVENFPKINDEFSGRLQKATAKQSNQISECSIENDFRFDCYPEADVSEEKCEARGCCWVKAEATNRKTHGSFSSKAQDLNVPWCFYPKNYPDYTLVNYTKTKTGVTAFFSRNGSSYYPKDIQLLQFEWTFLGQKHMNIKIFDPANKRYEVPYPKIKRSDDEIDFRNSDYELVIKKPRDISIVHKSNGFAIFNMTQGGFLYTDQFIQISMILPSPYIYGLGERRDNFLRSVNWQQFTMFAADQAPRDNSNLYGSHPFFLSMRQGQAMGVLLLNSNAMDVILQPAPAITFRTVGGILDFHVFASDSPAEIISLYTNAIGLPILPPYWSLGFHLCRFGYLSSNNTRKIWEENRRAGIPFDVQWNDIDYMDHRKDFSYDKTNFSGLPDLVKDIHNSSMHYVLMIDPAIDVPTSPGTYPPFDDGVKDEIFIKNASDELFIGKVWSPHGAVWPDFTNPNTSTYWTNQVTKFHTEIPFDGIWIDMNEPSNFYSGTLTGCPNSTLENPPYVPNVNGGKLYHLTVCMTAKQHASLHYNVHNLYGFSEAINTNTALKAIRAKRPFIISRSSFPGHGHYAGHWTGDIFSTWEDMQKSIPGILDFNMFGIPLVGADICGFNGNTTAKLCQRWMELGAFYPFARNHNSDDTVAQDPVSLGPEVVQASIKAFRIRYLFLPYLYTLFYKASVYGETVARPLFFEFPNDVSTYGIDTHFMWGNAMLILPVLKEDVTTVDYYIPEGRWYLFEKFQLLVSNGSKFSIDAPLDTINIALRGGYILPMQPVHNTTTESRKYPFGLLVALDEKENATGDLFWDDGDTLDTVAEKKYNLLRFVATKGKLTSSALTFGYLDQNMTLGTVTTLGVNVAPINVTVNGQKQNFTYSAGTKSLLISNLTVPLNQVTILWN